MTRKGFFSTSQIQSTRSMITTSSKCGLCGLYKTCHSPKMAVTGRGQRKILVVAEAPGWEEDQQGIQLIGKAGKRFRRHCRNEGINLERDCWKTNALICRPPENKTPSDTQLEACRPALLKTIKELKPNVIILLGLSATKTLMCTMWKKSISTLSTWVGWEIPSQLYNAWIIPTYHPSYVMRVDEDILDTIFESHLASALKASKHKPWDIVLPTWTR